MKKTVYTIAFIALFGAINAQTNTKVKKEEPVKSEKVNADGTLAPASPQGAVDIAPQDSKKTSTEQKPEGGTRMAITEKGVPASKKPAPAKKTQAPKTEPQKTEKH